MDSEKCCSGRGADADADAVRETVRKAYGDLARSEGSCCAPKSCCGTDRADELARGIGYAEADLASLPDGANMGLSCGNPTALASLREGEVVADLGAGGGFDVFLAARRVGPSGRAIGVDMTPDMVTRARRNAQAFRKDTGLENVEFRLGEIEHLPLADASVDVVLSNCVINLSPDKAAVWREVARVLRPGGRVAVTDLALLKPLPPAVLASAAALTGCVAGAVLVEETERMLGEAGLTDIRLTASPGKVDAMDSWSDSFYRSVIERLPEGEKLSSFVTSLSIEGRKPA
jgi:SAM-dependent methyltransferase